MEETYTTQKAHCLRGRIPGFPLSGLLLPLLLTAGIVACSPSQEESAPRTNTQDIRQAVAQKLEDAFAGKGEPIGPVLAYNVSAYNKEQGIVTLLVLTSDTPGAAPREQQLCKRVIFLNQEEEAALSSFPVPDDEDSRLEMTGYIDTEYDCFVCLKARKPIY